MDTKNMQRGNYKWISLYRKMYWMHYLIILVWDKA